MTRTIGHITGQSVSPPYSSAAAAAAAAMPRPSLKLQFRRRRFSNNRLITRRTSKHNRGRRRDLGRRRRTEPEVSKDDDRKWVSSSVNLSGYKDKFVVLSYNILGADNASKHGELYCRVSWEILDWNNRKMLIRDEIRRYKPTILCLQEVDNFEDLVRLLGEDGYEGVYKGRTGAACDGCAMFWREDTCKILYQEGIEFQKFGLRDNVAQLCVLQITPKCPNSAQTGHKYVRLMPLYLIVSFTKPSIRNSFSIKNSPSCSRTLLVGNTHLLFNPARGDIKLGQIQMFLTRAHSISQKWNGIPFVFCSDLNSTPVSPLYKFLASSEMDLLMHDRREISGTVKQSYYRCNLRTHQTFVSYRWTEEEIRLASGGRRCTDLKHNFRIKSAYPGVPGNRDTRDKYGEPLVTTYHSQYMGTVDYIWHSDELVPLRVVETLPVDVLRDIGGLPCEKWGSDHLALVCELAFAADA